MSVPPAPGAPSVTSSWFRLVSWLIALCTAGSRRRSTPAAARGPAGWPRPPPALDAALPAGMKLTVWVLPMIPAGQSMFAPGLPR